jgi:hypothetical protein
LQGITATIGGNDGFLPQAVAPMNVIMDSGMRIPKHFQLSLSHTHTLSLSLSAISVPVLIIIWSFPGRRKG